MRQTIAAGLCAAIALAAGSAHAGDEPDAAHVEEAPTAFEVGALVGPAFDDRMVGSVSTSVVARYFASGAFAAGLEGSYLSAIDPRSELERWENDRLGFAAQVAWVPLHERLGDEADPALDLYLFGAIGMVSSKPVPLQENREVQVAISALAGPGAGLRMTLASWLATAFELRNDFYLGAETRSVASARMGLTFVMPAE